MLVSKLGIILEGMKKKLLLPLILISSFVLLTSCQKDKVTIELEENPTTGYSWTFTQDGDGQVELVKDKYQEKGKDKDMVGRGGVHTFTFKAKTDGVCYLKFEYIRPWEDGAIERKIYKLEIKDKHFVNL